MSSATCVVFKKVVFAKNYFYALSKQVSRMTNGFGYFCQNKSNIRTPSICLIKVRLRRAIFSNLDNTKLSFTAIFLKKLKYLQNIF